MLRRRTGKLQKNNEEPISRPKSKMSAALELAPLRTSSSSGSSIGNNRYDMVGDWVGGQSLNFCLPIIVYLLLVKFIVLNFYHFFKFITVVLILEDLLASQIIILLM